MLTARREEKKRGEKNPKRTQKALLGPVSLCLSLFFPSCHREHADVILEITLLKINVGLEECVIVP